MIFRELHMIMFHCLRRKLYSQNILKFRVLKAFSQVTKDHASLQLTMYALYVSKKGVA